jgi:hypothetical protein
VYFKDKPIKVTSPAPGPLVWECKNHKTLDISGWLKETEQERQNANAQHGILVVKRRYGDPGDQYAIMRLDDLVHLLQEAGYGN